MSYQYISTKFFIPEPRKKLIRRGVLIGLLNRGLDKKLILVSAPAGYGKTTLVISWIKNQDIPVSWVSIDTEENDFYRFFGYFMEALHRVIPPLGENVLQMLESPMPPSQSLFTEMVLNEISNIKSDVILVIDDFHLIHNPEIHKSFFQVIERAPKELHFIICSRKDTPFPVSRLRSSDELIELSQSELSLTNEESQIYINNVMGMELDASDIDVLHDRTEGWLVGIQLAAISLVNTPDPSGFIHSLTGDNRLIGDYLVDEVLSNCPENIKNFLLKTSVLNRLTAPLCNFVLQIENSQELLESIDKLRLFIVPLDDRRGWFRYHHLFREMLFARLIKQSPETLSDLYRRASSWKISQGLKEEAIGYLLSARDFSEAAVLIKEIGVDLVSHGRWNTVLNWFSRIPNEELLKLQQLWMTYFTTLLNAGLITELSEKIKELAAAELSLLNLSEGDQNKAKGELAAFQGVVELHRMADPSSANKSLKSAITFLSKDYHFRLAFARINYSISCLLLGNLEEAQPLLEADIEWGKTNKQALWITMGNSYLAEALALKGDLDEAINLFQETIRFVHGVGLQHSPVFSKANLGLGSLFFERNQLEDSLKFIMEGIRLAEKGGYMDQLLFAYEILIRILWLKGDYPGIHETIHQAREMIEVYENPPTPVSFINAIEAVIAQKWGDSYIVDKWLRDVKEKPLYATDLFMQFERICFARVLSAREDYDVMKEVMKPAWEHAIRQNRIKDIIACEVLMAKCLFMQGEPLPAMAILQKALFKGAPNHFVRTFLDEGKVVVSMIKQMLNNRGEQKPGPEECPTEYLYFLLAEVAKGTVKVSTNQPLSQPVEGMEPLTRQEMHILHLLEAGYSNKQVSLEMNISLNTVKFHLKNIYTKLGVVNRTQAATIFRLNKDLS